MKTTSWPLLLLAALLAGCAGSGNAPLPGPVSEQISADAARQRAKVHTELGMAYLAGNQLNVALDEARVALAADAAYPLAYNLLGLTYMRMKEYAQAEEHFQQALRLAPNDPEVSNNLGWFYCESGREKLAFAHLDTAARNPLYATPVRALVNGGICALRINDTRLAENYLKRALQLDPGNPDASFLMADVLYRHGNYAEARKRLLDAHRVAVPTAASAWLGLRIERREGDREAEMRWALQLRRKFPDSPEYRKLSQGQYE